MKIKFDHELNIQKTRYFIYKNGNDKKYWNITIDTINSRSVDVVKATSEQEETWERQKFERRNDCINYFESEIAKKLSEGYIETPEKDLTFYHEFYKTEIEDITNKIKNSGLIKKAWRPIIEEKQGDLNSSKFFGYPFLNKLEDWPCCPICNNEMKFIFQFNNDELPDEAKNENFDILQMFIGCCIVYDVSNLADFPYLGETYIIRKIKKLNNKLEIEERGYFNNSKEKWSKYRDWYNYNYNGNEPVPNFNKRIVNISEQKILKKNIENLDFEYTEKVIIGWEEIIEYPDESCVNFENFGIVLNKREKNALSILNSIFQIKYITKINGYTIWEQSGTDYQYCTECKDSSNIECLMQLRNDENIEVPVFESGYVYSCKKHKNVFLYRSECS
jgi:hypothetical protein